MATWAHPFLDAIDQRDYDLLEQLIIEKEDEVNKGDKDGYSPLHMAVDFGDEKAAKMLLRCAKCNVNPYTYFHRLTPLHFAAQDGRNELVELLIDNGADINARNHSLGTPLNYAVCGQNVSTVQLLIALGADVNLGDSSGLSPLLQGTYI